MGLETATYINDLVTTNPVGASDTKSQGDDHLRLIKEVLQNSFPNMTAPGVFDLLAALVCDIKTTGNGATAAPQLRLRGLNAGLLDNEFGPRIFFNFLSDLGTERNGGSILLQANDVSDTEEDTTLFLQTMIAGVLTSRITLSPTGIALSAGTLTVGGVKVDAFPSGTKMLFQQTAAPTGWTKDVTHDNKALRIVNGTVGSGGTVAFTTVFGTARATTSVVAGGTNAGTAITTANLPSHTHAAGTLGGTALSAGAHSHTSGTLGGTALSAGNHTHTVSIFGTGALPTGAASGITCYRDDAGVNGTVETSSSAGAHTHTVDVSTGSTASAGAHTHTLDVNTGATAATGSGTTHTHTFTGITHSHTTNLEVQYVDVIIATKD